MAHYTYRKVAKTNHAWIDCLRIVDPTNTASPSYTEIHFTEPKKALVAMMTRPHVTFQRGAKSTHWYLVPRSDSWGVELGGKNTDLALKGEGEIAQKVVDDAVALNYINKPAPTKLVDKEGFQMAENRKQSKARVVKSYKR